MTKTDWGNFKLLHTQTRSSVGKLAIQVECF